jgi:hypothetical protein
MAREDNAERAGRQVFFACGRTNRTEGVSDRVSNSDVRTHEVISDPAADLNGARLECFGAETRTNRRGAGGYGRTPVEYRVNRGAI